MKREKATTQRKRNNRTSKTRPRVGIFLLFGSKLILNPASLNQAEAYGEARTHPRGHLQHWTELRPSGVLSPEIEYEDLPHGRVVYYPRD